MQQVTQKSQDSLISIENEWRNEKANGFILIDIYKILNLLWDDIPCILPLLQYEALQLQQVKKLGLFDKGLL